MNLIFHIRKCIFGILFVVNSFGFAQEKSEQNNQDKLEEFIDNERYKLGFGAIEYAQPFTSGNNFFGIAMEGKGGFNLKAQFFLYKHIFLSGTLGTSYFDVTDKSIVGNYNKTTLNHQFVSLGYEIILHKSIRIGLSFSVFGDTQYENKSRTNSKEAFQKDEGKVRSYNAYLDYMLNDEFAIYFSYAYRNDKTNILTAPEIQSLFEQASFHNFGIGVKLYFGQSSVFSKVIN